ncbi:VanW family protein [Kribbella solani]|uniref:Vancomycin resistance protein YoaR n=1 Tax=Kribbella solani TaxID=236067 RepID=A0A841E566_9ACTN|nr:VanW family protein [Kribbella solani]MBB5983517.1 vancomycin resistance protein YoaR [Kribbella solani]MDX3002789.1 VanW family protein [Kribbella solani]
MGRKQLAGIIAAAGFGVVVVAYGAAFAFAGDKVPGDTTVLGIPLGGLSKNDAKAKLEAGLKDRAGAPIALTAGGSKFQVVPADAGLSVDVDATVAAAGAGRSLAPGRILRALSGGDAVEPVVTKDDGKLKAAVDKLAGQVNRPATEGTITFKGTRAVRHDSADGLQLDTAKAPAAVLAAYPSNGEPKDLPVSVTKPKAGSEAIAKAMKEFAEPAMSGPVRLSVGSKSVDLTAAELAPALTLTAREGEVIPALNTKALEPLFEQRFKSLETLPKDATVQISGAGPKVVPAVDGMVVDRAKIGAAILAALPKPTGERRATVPLIATKAKFTTEQATALGITQRMGDFTTQFPHGTGYRNVNIGTAAAKINGTLLKPGETFSLNKVVGERTKENGFTEGNIISGGKFVLDLGGGVSQSATTTFNAAFFAGLKILEHKAHSVYIDRYPVGREATVAWPSVDLKFLNDSGHGVLVQTIFKASTPGTQGSIRVIVWGTKTWQITAGQSERTNYRSPSVVYNTAADCRAQAPTAGFDITVFRYFAKNGARVKTESFTTKYNAADDIRCGPKPGTPVTPPPGGVKPPPGR